MPPLTGCPNQLWGAGARQRETVTASLKSNDHPLDPMADLYRLVTPAMQELEQGFLV